MTTHAEAVGVVVRNRFSTGKSNRFSCLKSDFCVPTCVATQKSGFMQDISAIVLTGGDLFWEFFDLIQIF
jgi:hypothetical protein